MPWTLPSSLIVIVGPTTDYAIMRVTDDLELLLAGQRATLAGARLGAYVGGPGENPGVIAHLKSSNLTGRGYHPIFDYYNTAGHRSEGAVPGPSG